MSRQTPEMTPADHIARAKAEIAAPDYVAAQTHVLVAIAELLARSITPDHSSVYVVRDKATGGLISIHHTPERAREVAERNAGWGFWHWDVKP